MKKIVITLLVAVCLTACGSITPNKSTSTNDTTEKVIIEPIAITLATDTLSND